MNVGLFKATMGKTTMTQTVVIVGQGYVGLPLAQAASRTEWDVVGYDINPSMVENLNRGLSHIDDLSDADIDQMLQNGYRATADPSAIGNAAVVVVCVPTPLGEGGAPDLRAIEGSMETIGSHLNPGATVILESTTYPGTTEDFCAPILERVSGLKAGEDFHLAFSPERVDPGRTDFNITNTPKLVGGVTEASNAAAVEFYSAFVDTVVPVSGTREAETAKLLENTFRHINIALVNEMAKFCHELGIDIWEVIRGASTKPFGFMKFTPGPGVGGHCIPIDPNYLSYEVRRQLGYPFRFVELAQEINSSMPSYVVSRAAEVLNEQSKAVRNSKVLLLGVTYKPNIADQRESPALQVAELFLKQGAEISFHDPMVSEWVLEGGKKFDVVEDLTVAVAEADLVVVLQKHSSYDMQKIVDSGVPVLDTSGAAPLPANRL